MVRGSVMLLKVAASGLNKTLLESLVCPLSRQPLRFCEETNSLISDAVGVSFPLQYDEMLEEAVVFGFGKYFKIKDGIPCLVPADGKILDTDAVKSEDGEGSSGNREVE